MNHDSLHPPPFLSMDLMSIKASFSFFKLLGCLGVWSFDSARPDTVSQSIFEVEPLFLSDMQRNMIYSTRDRMISVPISNPGGWLTRPTKATVYPFPVLLIDHSTCRVQESGVWGWICCVWHSLILSKKIPHESIHLCFRLDWIEMEGDVKPKEGWKRMCFELVILERPNEKRCVWKQDLL